VVCFSPVPQILVRESVSTNLFRSLPLLGVLPTWRRPEHAGRHDLRFQAATPDRAAATLALRAARVIAGITAAVDGRSSTDETALAMSGGMGQLTLNNIEQWLDRTGLLSYHARYSPSGYSILMALSATLSNIGAVGVTFNHARYISKTITFKTSACLR
jgi:hypothetical protein